MYLNILLYTLHIKCTLFSLLSLNLLLPNIYSSNLPSSGSLVDCHVIFTLAFFSLKKIYTFRFQVNIISPNLIPLSHRPTKLDKSTQNQHTHQTISTVGFYLFLNTKNTELSIWQYVRRYPKLILICITLHVYSM